MAGLTDQVLRCAPAGACLSPAAARAVTMAQCIHMFGLVGTQAHCTCSHARILAARDAAGRTAAGEMWSLLPLEQPPAVLINL